MLGIVDELARVANGRAWFSSSALPNGGFWYRLVSPPGLQGHFPRSDRWPWRKPVIGETHLMCAGFAREVWSLVQLTPETEPGTTVFTWRKGQ